MYPPSLQDAVLESFKRENSYASCAIDHFNHFVTSQLPYILNEYGSFDVPTEKERHVVRLFNTTIHKPVIDVRDPIAQGVRATLAQDSFAPLYPDEARARGLTYAARVFIDIEHTVIDVKHGTTLNHSVHKEVPLFELPAMLGSMLCHTSTNDDVARSECFLDRGGYFIVRGNAKVLTLQKSQRINVHLVKREDEDGGIDMDIRSLRADEKFRSSSTLYMHLGGSPRLVTIDVPFLKPKMPIVAAFRVLGVDSKEDIEHLLFDAFPFGPDEDGIARRVFAPNLADPLLNESLDNIYDLFGSTAAAAKATTTKDKTRKQIANQLAGEFLPHLGLDDSGSTRFKKTIYLCAIIRRMLNVLIGRADPDDRDFEGFKSVQMSAGILSLMFRQQFASCLRFLKNRMYDRATKGKFMDLSSLFSDTLSNDVLKAFSDGEVTVSKDSSNSGMSVIQLANQINPLGLQTHIERVSTPLPRDGKYTHLRGLDSSKLWGFCPAETPEGHGAGLLENLATFARVRLGAPHIFMIDTILALHSPTCSVFAIAQSFTDQLQSTIPLTASLIFVNSEPVAFTLDAEQFLSEARAARRESRIPFDSSIICMPHGISISSDMGVIVFPLIHLPSFHAMPKAIELARGGKELYSAMCAAGLVDMVNAAELLEYRVAFSPAEIETTGRFPHTHLALHPSGFLGTCASTVPWSDHDQAPRVAYQSGMVKQAISIPATNIDSRLDFVSAHTLWYPQRPLADTAVSRACGVNEWPTGENLIIAIAPYGGLSQEDSIIRNAASVDRGSGRTTAYKVVRSTCRRRSGENETFEHPMLNKPGGPRCDGLRGMANYDKLCVDGLPENGTIMRNNDALIGRVLNYTETDAGGQAVEARRDRSVILTCEPYETYIVDTVMLSTTEEGHHTVRIRLRTSRIPQEGNKLSSRHGQKGTIGTLLSEEDMPFVMSGPNEGMKPDAIINLQCINSRMTIGKLLEILFSSLGVVTGEFMDATPFRQIDARGAISDLLKHGYGTEETMVDGVTGEVMKRPWFIGPCFYQTLKHMVLDKIAVRQRGQRAILTRQPLDGRANHGGQRMGGMEVDALMAHGASFALDSISRIASDAHTASVCTACGHIGDAVGATLAELGKAAAAGYEDDDEKPGCRVCGESRMVLLPTTYCYSNLLIPELATCGVRVVHHFETE